MLNEELLSSSSMKCPLSLHELAGSLLGLFSRFLCHPSLYGKETPMGRVLSWGSLSTAVIGGKVGKPFEEGNCLIPQTVFSRAILFVWIIRKALSQSLAPARPHPRWRPCPEGRSLPRPPCAALPLRRETREVMAEPPEATEGFRWRTQQGGSRWGERGWRRQRATMNNKFDAWVSPRVPPERPPARGLHGPEPCRRFPLLPRRRAGGTRWVTGLRGAPSLQPGPGPALRGCGAKGCGWWAGGSPAPGSREPPRGSACLSPFPALRREWGGRKDLWGAGCWRRVCCARGRGERGGQESAEVPWQVFVWAPWVAGNPDE